MHVVCLALDVGTGTGSSLIGARRLEGSWTVRWVGQLEEDQRLGVSAASSYEEICGWLSVSLADVDGLNRSARALRSARASC
jgi:hypothetical protein